MFAARGSRGYDSCLVTTGSDSTKASTASSRNRARLRVLRAAAGVVVVALTVAAAIIAILRERHAFDDALSRLGTWNALASFALGTAGVGLTYPVWRSVLRGLDLTMPGGPGARVFFVSQLGKYLPGSIWPVLMQMEAGRAHGATRRTMLIANLFTLVLGCSTGLALACVLLPLSDAHALAHYWWLFLALVVLLPLLHPRAMPAVINRAAALVHLGESEQQLPVRTTARATGFVLASYLLLGAHVGLLAVAIGGGGFSTFVLCTGGMALALPAGVLFIPAPSGAGVRDVILALVLSYRLDAGQALAVILSSRVLLIAVDLALAGGATALVGLLRRRSQASSADVESSSDTIGA